MRSGIHIHMAVALCLTALGAGASLAADDALVASAKKEGRAVWYTSQIINQFVQPAALAFEKRYGIKVDYVRNTANDLTINLLNEGKAGKIQADIFDGTTSASVLKKEGVALQWQPDSARRLPDQYRDKDGFWVATNLYVLTPGVNTELVRPGTEPRTFDALLDPKWKGKIVWNSSPSTSGAGGFVGIALAAMGDEKGMDFLRRLARQDIVGMLNASRAGLDAVVSGEFPIALNIFNNHTIISRALGAPVAWIPMQPAMAVLSVVSVTKGGPHPNAGKLLVDFLVSEEGQKLFRDADYIPVDPGVPPRDPGLRPDSGHFDAIYFTPEQVAASMPRWMQIFKDLFG
jgi:ABC-type Fe3+ transport system substrate-binding protein